MIQIINICETLDSKLQEFVLEGKIKDYRVYLRTNENVFVYIQGDTQESEDSVIEAILSIYSETNIEFVEDDEGDDFYTSVFAKKDKIIYENGRRRLNSLWNKTANKQSKIPIVSFYSYKGGMGRTTTLASFAMYLTLKHRKNVFIIDCDLEAPGFNNFFLKNPSEQNQHQGLIEYLIDKETGYASKEKLNLYSSEISHEYSGEGIIRVMYAGNLNTNPINDNSSDSDLSHYVEGLSRLDLSNVDYSSKLFDDLFEDIKDAYSPDVILIDSKTGISDVMGLTVCSLSDLVVGFFRNDSQSWPGLYYFTKIMVERSNIEPFIINSILPSALAGRGLFASFKDKVTSIIEMVAGDEAVDFPCFAIYRNDVLEMVGTPSENVEDLPYLIQTDEYKQAYKDLFDVLNDRLDGLQNADSVERDVVKTEPEDVRTEGFQAYSKDQINKLSPIQKVERLSQTKKYILSKAYDSINSLDLYGDNLSIPDEIKNGRFFFRDCMNDLFNQDKYLVLGSKGTGKSYLYRTLRSNEGVAYLKKMTKREGNFVFLYTIDKNTRIFSVSKLPYDYNALKRYRFWMVYTWNTIFNDLIKVLPSYHNADASLAFPIKDDESSTTRIDELISNDNYIISIEKEFSKLDDYLSKENYSVSIVYDQLDEIVRPTDWNNWIPELLNIWRVKRFSNISGKVFLRTDLFRGLVGLTNKNDIENKAINVEWSKEEIYSYFFKIIMSENVKEAFWEYMNLSGKEDYVKQCRQNYKKNNNQFKLDDYILRPMMQTFFGENVDVNQSTRMGSSYDWFYKNLKNADDTISIRPFIDLLKMAMELQKDNKYQSEESSTPILYQKYYTDKDVRLKAVRRHYQDLVENTVGNKPIEYIFDFISNTTDNRFKKISIRKVVFEEMLSEVIETNKEKEGMSNINVDDLKNLLIVNGMVKRVNYGRGDEYVFSFLYKYSLGLRGV